MTEYFRQSDWIWSNFAGDQNDNDDDEIESD